MVDGNTTPGGRSKLGSILVGEESKLLLLLLLLDDDDVVLAGIMVLEIVDTRFRGSCGEEEEFEW